MAKINVMFIHPSNGQELEVEIEDSLTASAIVNELIASGFVPDDPAGYKLYIKTPVQKEISGSTTAASGGAAEGYHIRVIPLTDAGILKKIRRR